MRGYVQSPQNPELKERFITSRSGIFQVSNLKAGDYVLTFGRKPYEKIPISIPPDASGLYRIGSLSLSSKVQEADIKETTALEEQVAAMKKQKKEFGDTKLFQVLV